MSNEHEDALRSHTVDVILGVRRMYLANGANPLKHWDQIESRMRAASRTTTSVAEWVTSLQRGLQLGAPDASTSVAVEQLASSVREGGDAKWLDMVERESGYILAMARLESERRKESRGKA